MRRSLAKKQKNGASPVGAAKLVNPRPKAVVDFGAKTMQLTTGWLQRNQEKRIPSLRPRPRGVATWPRDVTGVACSSAGVALLRVGCGLVE